MQGKVIAWLVIAATGCADYDPPQETAAELWCSGLCGLEQRCMTSRYPDSCRADCVANRPGLANFSAQGAQWVGSCIEASDCSMLFDEVAWHEGLDACWAEAQAELEPTPRIRAFCTEFIVPWFECGYWFAGSECERIYGMWAAPVIDRLETCMTISDCEAFEGCVTGVFESL